jgi:hypothetical protein
MLVYMGDQLLPEGGSHCIPQVIVLVSINSQQCNESGSGSQIS